MTNPYTPSSAIDFIEHFEANNLNATNPFYYEPASGTNPATINFGYGINLTAAENAALAGNSTVKTDLIAWLSTNGIAADSTNVAGVAWSSFSTTSLTANGNGSSIASSLNGNLAPGDYTSAANNITTNYVNTIVVDGLTANIPNFAGLPTTTQWAFEAMYYNGSATLGPITYGAANSYSPGNGQLAVIAEQLAFNANASTNPNLPGAEERYLGSALLAMGVIPTYDTVNGSANVITNVNASGANTSDVVKFLQDVLNPSNILEAAAYQRRHTWPSGAVLQPRATTTYSLS